MSSRPSTRMVWSALKTPGLTGKAPLVAVAIALAVVAAVLLLSMASRTGPPAERKALGPANAPVRIVVYFDFQCPHCDSLRSGAEAQIIEEYVKTGKAHLEVRTFAVMGPDSVRAAEAALCAADQGRFWEYRDALFAAYRQNGRAAYAVESLVGLAKEVGLDAKVVESCLAEGRRKEEVQAEIQMGQAEGVQRIPTVLINGKKVEGALPFPVYATLIEESLAK